MQIKIDVALSVFVRLVQLLIFLPQGQHQKFIMYSCTARTNLRGMAQKGVQAFAGFHVPEPGSVVHAPRGHHRALRVEAQAHDFGGVAPESVVQVAVLRGPQLAGFVWKNKST